MNAPTLLTEEMEVRCDGCDYEAAIYYHDLGDELEVIRVDFDAPGIGWGSLHSEYFPRVEQQLEAHLKEKAEQAIVDRQISNYEYDVAMGHRRRL